MTQTCIVVGASHAAAQLVTSLRQEGWDGEILVISDERHLPYHRPPLSKAFLSGARTAESLAIRPAAFYEKQNVQFRQGRVTAINRDQQTLTFVEGAGERGSEGENEKESKVLSYDKLALCIGARVRKVDLPGCDLSGIHYLRDMADAESIKANITEGQHAVIIGGGYVGLETAALLRQLGMQVTVLEMGPRILGRVTAPEVSDFYHRVHMESGVRIHTGVSIGGFSGNGQVGKVVCTDGAEFPADLVVIGVGVLPNTELAEMAGLAVENGIVVDEFCRTIDPNIVAAGDCANQFNKLYACRVRLESVPNATEQAKIAAASICGCNKSSASLPWFWSDQYDLKLQIAGLSQGYDQVIVRGDRRTGRSFAAFYLKEGRLIAADCINRPQEFVLSKRIIAQKLTIQPERLADDSVPVKELLMEDSPALASAGR
ncbi:3-phenylpropionate/trans-cinnamate dioxygenase ferredoxin reductase subunit [Marinobacter sp. LV10R510-11A]|uniref:NAD(P)/FAD-dependent oxidoreductase n=1 Tax=Marinobacter sp. LV10R510-11A TaxID=1415568 RepID=UPI000BB67CC0|nr:FAD-dependent oxidoreductase [Marinobacter sp. LV10R510-11A]SOB76998.1 3-phenylpropionate/trans-cinnamate dioxygenase ferredoxin reductase subunit [Marinobacter sp. LV10R510-11A]